MLYKVDRFSRVHAFLRTILNNVLWALPDSVKYPIGRIFRSPRAPYRYLRPGDTAVQLGAPWDLLKAGRSRAIYFSMFVGPSGRVLVIEPDPENIRQLNAFLKTRSISNVSVLRCGAWEKKDRLRFLINPRHPASNIVEVVSNDGKHDLTKYTAVDIDVDTLDSILADQGIETVDLLSITTNGSEVQILRGLSDLADRVKYLSVIGDPDKYAFLGELGFQRVGEDDRGNLYVRANAAK